MTSMRQPAGMGGGYGMGIGSFFQPQGPSGFPSFSTRQVQRDPRGAGGMPQGQRDQRALAAQQQAAVAARRR